MTVDVTGVWIGSMVTRSPTAGSISYQVRLDLEQQGPKAKGYFRPLGGGIDRDAIAKGLANKFEGPIDGTVGGDVFTFKLTNGTTVGEMTVSGDEMNGNVTIGARDQSVAGLQAQIFLRRVNSPAPSRSQ